MLKLLLIGSAIAGAAVAGYLGTRELGEDGPQSPQTGAVARNDAPTDYMVRALGDSVTGAFGYYADGSEVPGKEIRGAIIRDLVVDAPHCRPPSPPDGRCQSPDVIAYPAVFAKERGLRTRPPDFDNLAVSGSTPAEWAEGGLFHDELENVVAADPDLTVLTLGANPLLGDIVGSLPGQLCARINTKKCVAKRIAKERVVERLASIYGELLETEPGGAEGTVAVMQYPSTVPLPGAGANIDELFAGLSDAIREAYERTRSENPDEASRLVLVDPGPFAEHDCGASEPWILLADLCIHPNALGHQKMAEALAEAIGDRSDLRPTEDSEEPSGDAFTVEVRENGEVVSVGAYKPGPIEPNAPTNAFEVATVMDAFGPPDSRGLEPGAFGCFLRWKDLRITAEAADYSNAQEPCADGAGVDRITVGYDDLETGLGGGDPAAERWTTAQGLRVGDSTKRLEELYPDSYVSQVGEHTIVLIDEPSAIGTTGRADKLSANTYDGKVTGLVVSLYGAGE